MIDPYKPPVSDVKVEEVKRKTIWKVFFWLILILEVLSLIDIAFDPNKPVNDLLIEAVIYSAILMGLFGYAYSKRIFNKLFWKFVFPIGIAYDLYDFYGVAEWDWSFSSIDIVFAIIVFPLMYFQYLALYRYGFKSEEIWG